MSLDRRRFLVAGAVAAVAVACGKKAEEATSTASPDTASGATTATTSAPATTALPAGAPSATTTTTAAGAPSTTTKPASSSTTKGGAPSTTAPPTEAGRAPARFVSTGPTNTGAVALTFHTNGDSKMIQSVLDTVEKQGGVITAFIVGNWLDANPSMGARLTRGGHEFANHTYTHPTFESLSASGMATEVTKCRDAIARVNGSGGRWFRASGTDDGTAQPSAAALKAAGDAGYEAMVGFDVDPYDYKDPGKDAVVQRTLAQAKAGSIISLHMGHAGTVEAIGPIMDGLASKSLKSITLSALLDAR